MSERPFEVGEEVVLVSTGGWYRYISGKGKVAKFHKSGNFVLEGDSQQYNPNGYATGERRYREPHCVHADDEQIKEIELEKSFRDVRGDLESAIGDLRRSVSPSEKATKKMQKVLKLIQEIIDADKQPEDFERIS